jgi:hypothetical protein
MKPRTPDDFESILDRELAWRRKELTDLRLVVKTASGSLQTALRRAAVALAYAHWEGFAKAACQAYLDFVAMRRLQIQELAPCFAALAVRKMVMMESDRSPVALDISMVNIIRNKATERAYLQRHKVVETRSNLSSEVLQGLLCALGLPATQFEPKFNFLDHKLLASRNEIAHGRETAPSSADYDEIHDQVMQMIQDLSNELRNAVALARYRHSKDQQDSP